MYYTIIGSFSLCLLLICYIYIFKQTRSQVGSSVGVVLSEKMDESLYTRLIQAGFKIQIFPAVDYAVVSSFPYKNQYSLAIAVYRIYPMLKHYIKVHIFVYVCITKIWL